MKNRKQKLISIRTQTAGFSLLEVLVALLVLSVGLLGLAMLQVQGMQFNTDAYLRTQATYLAYDIIDRMRANKGAAGSSAYNANGPPSGSTLDCDDPTVTCDTAALAAYDLNRWYQAQAMWLPLNPGFPSTIEKAGNQYTITMRWNERDLLITQRWVVEL